MDGLLSLISSLPDLALVVLGFCLIVVIHELGHFLAARWAGIRVLAFAVGFGPAILSYRKGLGVRRGSSDGEYREMLRRAGAEKLPDVSPTEYRLNWIPAGGYVKMLGQEDLNPEAVSAATDSYQRCVPWKRMVVISAGVVMNLITAAMMFVAVFMIGLRTEPAKVGLVRPGSPASEAVALNAASLGVAEPGLKPGDELRAINGEAPNSFNDLTLATAMSERGQAVRLVIQRPGVPTPLEFAIVPEVGPLSGLLELGVEPARSAQVPKARSPRDAAEWEKAFQSVGLAGVKPGMTLTQAGVAGEVRSAADLVAAARASNGTPIRATFLDEAGAPLSIEIKPRAQLQMSLAAEATPAAPVRVVEHLLGLMPVMRIEQAGEGARAQGLRDGDVFVRIGAVEFPSLSEGIREIRAHAGKALSVAVRRAGEVETLEVRVSRQGTIGFAPGDTAETSTLLAAPVRMVREIRQGSKPEATPASALPLRPGSEIVRVGSTVVTSFESLRTALRDATAEARRTASGANVTLTLRAPALGAAEPLEEAVAWSLSAADVEALQTLGWDLPFSPALFETEQTLLKASGPLAAMGLGLHETKRVMLSTYMTFVRLFQGTVKVEHLKGPVGIVHVGTILADRGLVWLVFFMALISVNLAVINFLPLPIVDGGQFLFLLWEQIRGRPVPLGIQNAVTMVGLVLIGAMFLLVTFNDVRNLLGL
jgi:regulator of sigma E protease